MWFPPRYRGWVRVRREFGWACMWNIRTAQCSKAVASERRGRASMDALGGHWCNLRRCAKRLRKLPPTGMRMKVHLSWINLIHHIVHVGGVASEQHFCALHPPYRSLISQATITKFPSDFGCDVRVSLLFSFAIISRPTLVFALYHLHQRMN